MYCTSFPTHNNSTNIRAADSQHHATAQSTEAGQTQNQRYLIASAQHGWGCSDPLGKCIKKWLLWAPRTGSLHKIVAPRRKDYFSCTHRWCRRKYTFRATTSPEAFQTSCRNQRKQFPVLCVHPHTKYIRMLKDQRQNLIRAAAINNSSQKHSVPCTVSPGKRKGKNIRQF